MLKAGQAVRNRTHVAAALDVVLSAQGIHATAIAAHVPGEQRKVDKGNHIVHGVVMFGDTQSPADLGARSAGIRMGHLADGFRGHARLTLGPLQRVFLDVRFVGFKSAGGVAG